MTTQELDGIEGRARAWRLTTAEILYHMPDHPLLLQSFVWQAWDLAPGYPALGRFLDFWRRELDGPVHSVRASVAEPLTGPTWRHATWQAVLH